MEILKKIQNTCLILCFLSMSHSLFSQDTFFQEGSEEIGARAKSLTERYQPELVMTSDQTLLFEKKVEEFLLRGSKIKSMEEVTIRRKMRLLSKLSRQETAEMSNILRRPQLRLYKKIKKRLQPIILEVGQVEDSN